MFVKRIKPVSAISGISLFVFLAVSVRADLTTGSDNVTGSHGINWNYSYTRSFDGKDVVKDVEINFQFESITASEHQLLVWMQNVEQNIENQWNNKYRIQGSDGKTYGAKVDVTFSGPFNQTVVVKPGQHGVDNATTNMTTWHWDDAPGISAHEFGHMLGLYDEYNGGWLDPSNPRNDLNSLMGWGCLGSNPTMPERYYTQFSDYLHKLNESYTFTLVAIPAPTAILLGMIGLGMAGWIRKRVA